jgi:uncharacterized protein (TIGR00369 family)
MTPVDNGVEASDYARALGVRLVELSGGRARLVLPFREANSNPGGALHGGCAASLGLIGGHAVAAVAIGPEPGPLTTISCHVGYLSAAVGEDVVATTQLLRKGRTICFTATTVETFEGRAISHISTVVRSGGDAEDVGCPAARGDDGRSEPGPMGPFVSAMPFTGARGLSVEHMADGRSRIVMPIGTTNAGAGGAFHEGAVLALLDTTGAMASWALTGPGPYAASTVALESQMLHEAYADVLVAYGRVVHRDGEIFWAEVEVAGRTHGASRRPDERLVARGTVVYRIVT